MRALLISLALAATLAMPTAASEVGGAPASLLPTGSEAAPPPAPLSPLAADSAWTPRFEAAAGELAAALRSRDAARWGPLLGGPWLAPAERERVGALLRDRDSPFLPALFSKDHARQVLLGWSAPPSMSATERAAIEAGLEAEALVCWASGGTGEGRWPETAREADNRPGRPYACARIAYSIRGGTPMWRAFIEQDGGDLAAALPAGRPRLTNLQD
jgi:hypothetical protein